MAAPRIGDRNPSEKLRGEKRKTFERASLRESGAVPPASWALQQVGDVRLTLRSRFTAVTKPVEGVRVLRKPGQQRRGKGAQNSHSEKCRHLRSQSVRTLRKQEPEKWKENHEKGSPSRAKGQGCSGGREGEGHPAIASPLLAFSSLLHLFSSTFRDSSFESLPSSTSVASPPLVLQGTRLAKLQPPASWVPAKCCRRKPPSQPNGFYLNSQSQASKGLRACSLRLWWLLSAGWREVCFLPDSQPSLHLLSG